MKRTSAILLIIVVLLALPFWAILLLGYPMRVLYALSDLGSDCARVTLEWLLGAPRFWATLALADLSRYVTISAAALVAALAAIGILILRQRSRAWRHPVLYLCLAAIAGVLALPFAVGPYRPAVRSSAGVELRQVEQPGWLAGVVKGLQAGAEIRPLVYGPLGWADGQTLVYRTWRGAGYDRTGAWQAGIPGPAMAYDVAEGASRPWDGALDDLHRAACPNGACVRPLLTKYYQPADRLYFAGHYEDVLASPDGRRYAFVARHAYGPEDLVIVGRQEQGSRDRLETSVERS